MTAFGYDWVPGNLAGALVLREAGEAAVRVDLGYFFTGSGGSPAGGRGPRSPAPRSSRPSSGGRGSRPSGAAARVRTFDVEGRARQAVSAGSSEHFALPRTYPQLEQVNVLPRLVRRRVAGDAGVLARRGRDHQDPRGALGRAGRWRAGFVSGSTGGPDAEQRASSGSHIVAIAYDRGGVRLGEVHVAGVNGYDFTARVLAWGASQALEQGMSGSGALGPVEAFGLDELEAGCAEAGIARV